MIHMPLIKQSPIAGFAMVAAIALCGCSIPGIRWEDTGIVGPPLASGEPTKQIHRCDVVTASSPWASSGSFNRCDVAFRSVSGFQVDANRVQSAISTSLPNAIPLRPQLRLLKKTEVSKASNAPRVAYALYLVALNPIVVVGIPAKGHEQSCFTPGWKACFSAVESLQPEDRYAQRSSFAVHYTSHPPVRGGSFVLIPESASDSVPLPIDQLVATIDVQGKKIQLVQRGNTWQIEKTAP